MVVEVEGVSDTVEAAEVSTMVDVVEGEVDSEVEVEVTLLLVGVISGAEEVVGVGSSEVLVDDDDVAEKEDETEVVDPARAATSTPRDARVSDAEGRTDSRMASKEKSRGMQVRNERKGMVARE